MTLFAVGFLLVVGIGLIAADAAITIRRHRAAKRIRNRYTTSRRITHTYLNTARAGRTRPHHSHTPGDCSFGASCALIQRDNDRRAAL
jgi:hypothetical protein